MESTLRYPWDERFFYTDRETRHIGGGLVLWRGYCQSLRPAINRMLINVDTSSTAMYRSGKLIDLALEFLGRPGLPEALAPKRGLVERERVRLQRFISGIKITTPYRARDPDKIRLVKKLTPESAWDRTFEVEDGQTITIAKYFQNQLNVPLQFPDVICVEVCTIPYLLACLHVPQLSTGAIIPLELCEVPPGQLVRKRISPDKITSVLEFSTLRPNERMRSIRDGLGVCPE